MVCSPLLYVITADGPSVEIRLHFVPLGQNKGSPPSSRRRQRSSALHLDGFESDSNIKQKREAEASLFYLVPVSVCGARNFLFAERSRNFDRCTRCALAASATGGARARGRTLTIRFSSAVDYQ